jgi:hypothetical protein
MLSLRARGTCAISARRQRKGQVRVIQRTGAETAAHCSVPPKTREHTLAAMESLGQAAKSKRLDALSRATFLRSIHGESSRGVSEIPREPPGFAERLFARIGLDVSLWQLVACHRNRRNT